MPTGTGTGPCSLPRIPNGGPWKWDLVSDTEGYRTYHVWYRVEVDPALHGPLKASRCPGLPAVGSLWTEGALTDTEAFFTNEYQVSPLGRQGENSFYDVVKVASSKPSKDCSTEVGGDPLLTPNRVKVRTVNYQKEGVYDRLGNPIVNSAFEQIRGPQNEWDAHRLQVIIEQNVANMELDLVDSLMHNLNDGPLWGFDPRTVKLSEATIDPKYKANCDKYYRRTLVFDVSTEFDRCLLDEGTKALRGYWDKDRSSPTYGQYVIAEDEDGPYGKVDPNNPRNFIRYQDWYGNNARVLLNRGKPVDVSNSTTGTADDTPGRICVGYYPSGNLLLLGIPVDLENP